MVTGGIRHPTSDRTCTDSAQPDIAVARVHQASSTATPTARTRRRPTAGCRHCL